MNCIPATIHLSIILPINLEQHKKQTINIKNEQTVWVGVAFDKVKYSFEKLRISGDFKEVVVIPSLNLNI